MPLLILEQMALRAPPPFHTASTQVLLGLLLVMALRLALAIYVVPPWQGPDEPAHFLRVHLLYEHPGARPAGPESRTVEAAIIRSMAEHRWWEGYGTAAPDPLPADFSDPDLAEHVLRQDDAGPIHPQLGRAWLSLWRPDDMSAQFHALRWLSALISLGTLACAWAGTRLLFGDRIAGVTGLLLAMHPQLMLMSIAVNPSALVNLFGAIVWWQAARLAVTGAWTAVLLTPAAAVVALFAKRAAAPLLAPALLLASAGVLALVLFRRHADAVAYSARAMRWSAVAGTMTIVLLTLLVLQAPPSWRDAIDDRYISVATAMKDANTAGSGEIGRLMEYWSEVIFTEARRDRSAAFADQFNDSLFRSFWLNAGWLRYPAPPAWYVAIQVGIGAAVIGIFLGLLRRRSAVPATGLVIALFFAAVQVSATYLTFYQNGWYAQGQYLFPVIAPLMVLVAWGWDRLLSVGRASAVAAVMAVMLFVLDTSSWALVLLPAYFLN